jgi:hypothetical protein
MDINEHTQHHKLEKYAFLWSEARLVIAAVALFLGGIPPLAFIFRAPAFYSIVTGLLSVAWIISGAASAYLLYRWVKGGKVLFGEKIKADTVAFFVSIVSGINLGITGVTKTNIGMSFTSSTVLFVITGVIYLIAAYHLYNRWKGNGKKLF